MQFYLNHYLSNSLGELFFTSLVHLFMPRNEGSMLFMKKHHKVSFLYHITSYLTELCVFWCLYRKEDTLRCLS